MKTITTPQSKLDKVTHLLNIAKELNILHDKMFDKLMDKYESNYLMFDYMLENINSCILDKVSIQITADNFIELLEISNYTDLTIAVVNDKIYETKKLNYE